GRVSNRRSLMRASRPLALERPQPDSRSLTRPQKGRHVLGTDLNCSESRRGPAKPAVLLPNGSTRGGEGSLHCGVSVPSMSALLRKRTNDGQSRYVCFVPIAS